MLKGVIWNVRVSLSASAGRSRQRAQEAEATVSPNCPVPGIGFGSRGPNSACASPDRSRNGSAACISREGSWRTIETAREACLLPPLSGRRYTRAAGRRTFDYNCVAEDPDQGSVQCAAMITRRRLALIFVTTHTLTRSKYMLVVARGTETARLRLRFGKRRR